MIERGLSEKDAQNITEAANTDPEFLDDDPEEAADDELSYWGNDG